MFPWKKWNNTCWEVSVAVNGKRRHVIRIQVHMSNCPNATQAVNHFIWSEPANENTGWCFVFHKYGKTKPDYHLVVHSAHLEFSWRKYKQVGSLFSSRFPNLLTGHNITKVVVSSKNISLRFKILLANMKSQAYSLFWRFYAIKVILTH